jgi:hypothetical protein
MDSTHVTFGVLTAGWVLGDVKLEASAFHGREPDQFRWNIETGRLDSASLRVSWNPDEHWALQASHGYIHSPEQLEPTVNQRRDTASAMYGTGFGSAVRWDTTLAWGQDDNRPGHKLDAWLAESEVVVADEHTFFVRAEWAQKDELFEAGSLLAGQVFDVGKLSIGYIHDWRLVQHLRFGLGGLLSLYQLPVETQASYGGSPHSYMLFARLKID